MNNSKVTEITFSTTHKVVERVTYNTLIKEHNKYWASFVYDPTWTDFPEPLMFKEVYNWAIDNPKEGNRKIFVLDHGDLHKEVK